MSKHLLSCFDCGNSLDACRVVDVVQLKLYARNFTVTGRTESGSYQGSRRCRNKRSANGEAYELHHQPPPSLPNPGLGQ